ncbi:hypothetical protein T440DRAFT_554817 [Plenodomus tracheiphilus IPT5]|uniref:DUF7924 domain-containing protein n=1 Tax=Plenodomus tracheiphilus IPT5 TaxID=1408161 RepID=A0A6A7B8D0_9PLEO|nr:hypothetical protein T440DRAFT_554817 [Plenodomus tracheiphilus IPT5]
MKRSLSNLDSASTPVPAAPPAKRPRTLPLTRDALSKIQVPQFESAASVPLWISACAHHEKMDPNRQHPRLHTPTLRRAKARSRTPSPVKKPPHSATPEYRNGTMKLALVFIERDPELPAHVAASVERVLGIRTTRHASGQKGEQDTAQDAHAATLAETYRAQCRSLASDCSGEGEWRSCIYSILINPLSKRWSPVLKISASEKPWNRYLKPAVLRLPTLGARLSFPIVFPPPPSAALGPFPSPTATPSQDDLSTSSVVSTTTSDYSTDDDLHLSTPKPDITVGLASDCITKALNLSQDILLHLQTDPNNAQPFVSDPHQVPLGLRFPFLIVEAKGLNTGSNLIHAQNQAAVAAASALNILSDLDALIPNLNVDAEFSIPSILFSLATEGPTHELWATKSYEVQDDETAIDSMRKGVDVDLSRPVSCKTDLVLSYAAIDR